ncbi:MAG TPA: hypothetical protein VNM50_08920 [Chloroflexota bacterium]|nr:hypothetical protein [Chloroflexota bacterium]
MKRLARAVAVLFALAMLAGLAPQVTLSQQPQVPTWEFADPNVPEGG